jgi:polygalacturonase
MRQLFLAFLLLTATTWVASGKTMDATKAGAIGDGATLNTAAIQTAIDVCSAVGGGTIQFPAGRYVTGTIQLKDNITLRLDKNAVLLGSTNAADFRNLDPFMAGDGVPLGYALIVAAGAKHAGIEGGGTIDGQGRELRAAQTRFTVRPFLMRWLHCTNVTVKDVHLANPGAWTLNFFQSYDATVERVTIRTRNTGLANNDGIDLDSCEKVSILDCDIESGDDALCLKTTSPLPCRNITASGCKLSTKCNAIKLGTESLGDFENISVTNCQIRNTGMAGIALYCVDGGQMHDVTITGITMNGVAVPVSVRLGARLKTFRAGDQPKSPGALRDVTIKDMHVTGARQIGLLINGITNHPVENLTLENIQIELAGGGKLSDAQIQLPEKESSYPEYSMFGKVMPAYVLFAWHVRGITFKNVQTTVTQSDARPATIFVDVEGAIPADFATSSHPTKQ